MKRIELTQEQRNMVLRELHGAMQDDGGFDIDIEVGDGITVNAKGYIYHDGYREAESFGTGSAWVDTGIIADVVLNCYVGEDEEAYDVGGEFENECYKFISVAA